MVAAGVEVKSEPAPELVDYSCQGARLVCRLGGDELLEKAHQLRQSDSCAHHHTSSRNGDLLRQRKVEATRGDG